MVAKQESVHVHVQVHHYQDQNDPEIAVVQEVVIFKAASNLSVLDESTMETKI